MTHGHKHWDTLQDRNWWSEQSHLVRNVVDTIHCVQHNFQNKSESGEPLEPRLSFQCQCNPREGCGNAWCWAASKWTYFLHVLNFRKSCKECEWNNPTTSRRSAFQSDANHQPLSILGQGSDCVCGRHHNLVKRCVFLGKRPRKCGCRTGKSPKFWILSLIAFNIFLSPETAGLKGFGSFSSQGAKSAFSKLKA